MLLAQVQDDGLLLSEVLEHRLERGFLAEARLEPMAGIERGLQVARPNGGGKTVIAVVRLRKRILVIPELHDAGDRTEDLFAADAVVVGDAGEDHGLHVIAALELGIAWHLRTLERLGAGALLAELDVG